MRVLLQNFLDSPFHIQIIRHHVFGQNHHIRTPIAQPWPENQNRFVIGVVDDLGNTGWFGPVSASVAAIIRDQIMPWAMGVEVRAWRSAATIRPQGRHRSGSHVRLAISAVELALWDLRSRILNLAIGDLIGGRARTVVPAYATAHN